MKIADEDAVLINLYLSKAWGAQKLLNEFPDKRLETGKYRLPPEENTQDGYR